MALRRWWAAGSGGARAVVVAADLSHSSSLHDGRRRAAATGLDNDIRVTAMSAPAALLMEMPALLRLRRVRRQPRLWWRCGAVHFCSPLLVMVSCAQPEEGDHFRTVARAAWNHHFDQDEERAANLQ